MCSRAECTSGADCEYKYFDGSSYYLILACINWGRCAEQGDCWGECGQSAIKRVDYILLNYYDPTQLFITMRMRAHRAPQQDKIRSRGISRVAT